MFRTASITCFVIVLVGIAIHCLALRPKLSGLFGKEKRKLKLVGALRKLVYLLALLCFAVLLVTGFTPRLLLGTPIAGYWLMLHATAAPVFAVCVAVLAVMWADKCRLDKNYWPWLLRILHHQSENKAVPEKHELAQKVCFWLIVFLALPLILSIILSMFPLFGTHWQEFLANVHRYCALLFALIVIAHTYLMVLVESKRNAAE